MIYRILVFQILLTGQLFCQQLQLHFDPRHAIDPTRFSRNYMTLFYQYFRAAAPDTSFIRAGSTMFQAQCDYTGANGNIGNVYVQFTQGVKFWDPDVYLDLEYSGGLGIVEPGSYGYYIANTYSIGATTTVLWNSTVFNIAVASMHTAFVRPSHDIRATVYWWKGLFNYTAEFAGDIQFWTQNRDHGDAATAGLEGKWVCFFGEPQIWFRVAGNFFVGSKVNIYYHILYQNDRVLVLPTIAVRYNL